MPESSRYTVRIAVWPADEAAIARVRRTVFVVEQAVPEALEWEEQDPACTWFVAEAAGGEVVGCARLTPDARIGRMAVLATWRSRGVGAALLAAALAEARRRGLREVRLSAQTHAIDFYARYGFRAAGDIYLDAGIPHRDMSLHFEEPI